MSKIWIKSHLNYLYKLNYILLFASAIIYLVYVYLNTSKIYNFESFAETLQLNPNFAVIIMLASINALVGWYLWTKERTFMMNLRTICLWLFVLICCQAFLLNLVLTIESILLLISAVLNHENFNKEASFSLPSFILLLFVLGIYLLCFYLMLNL